jgi:ribonuclease III
MDLSPYKLFASSTLGVDFNDIQLLVTACTHRSYVNEHKAFAKEHNERLEFLGDAVLELIVTEFLYKNHPDPEGILTNWRSALVRTESIGAAAKKIGVESLLRLSKGEKRGSDRARGQILANTYEALIGAVYLDQGYDAAKSFIEETLISTFETILSTGSWMDPKTRLQEVMQSEHGHTPQYRVLQEEGPDHDKTFTVGVFMDKEQLGAGNGSSKQIAQQEAAQNALAILAERKSTQKSE